MKQKTSQIWKGFFCILVGIGIVLAAFRWGIWWFNPYYSVDEMEHWQSAWLIHTGLVPYKNFFQHHHPLFWYTLQPFFWFLSPGAYFHILGRCISLALLFINIYWLLKISWLLFHKKSLLYGTLFFFFVNPLSMQIVYHFRPDQLMMSFFLVGFYCFLKFSIYGKAWELYKSFFWLFLSFMTLQKILLFAPGMALCVVFMLLKKRLKFSVLMRAFIVPGVLYVLWLGYMGFHNGLIDYYQLNFPFNALRDNPPDESVHDLVLPFCLSVLVAVILLFKKKGTYAFFIPYMVSLLFSLILPHPFLWYFLIPVYLSPILLALFLGWILSGPPSLVLFRMAVGIAVVYYSCFCIFLLCLTNNHTAPAARAHVETSMAEFIESNHGETALVQAGYDTYLPFHPIYNYYWMQLTQVVPYDVSLFHRHPMPDLNKIIVQFRPRFITELKVYDWPTFHRKSVEGCKNLKLSDFIIQKTDPEILKKYYHKTSYHGLYERND